MSVDIKELIKANVCERYEAYRIAKDTGFLTINEMREAENLETIEGMNVINVGLSSVLYDINKHIYYTPNTNATADINDTKSEEVKPEGKEVPEI